MSKKLYHLFLLQETEDTFDRVLGAARAMAIPLLLGLYLDNMPLAKMGAMGPSPSSRGEPAERCGHGRFDHLSQLERRILHGA